jgi:hypothetical protein
MASNQPNQPDADCPCRQNDQTTWTARGTDARGYEIVVCRLCNGFKGYRDPDRRVRKPKAQLQPERQSSAPRPLPTLSFE